MKQLIINTGSSRALFDASLALLKEHGYTIRTGYINPTNQVIVAHADGSLNCIPGPRTGFAIYSAETQFGELVDFLETPETPEVTELELGDAKFEVGLTSTLVSTDDEEVEIPNAKILELEKKFVAFSFGGFDAVFTGIKVGCQSFTYDDVIELADAIRAKGKNPTTDSYAGKVTY